MCGIAGIVNFNGADIVDRAVIEKMTRALTHRGPDDEGFFVEGRVGLGHRRLSIIDLSGGKQPIFNEDESAAIVFNGEIYNYRDLAARLARAGHIFKTRSDTETILHAYEEFGDDCVQHLRGMFGFAIWDRRARRLLLARDRLGVKPVYYYHDGRFLAFASEIKALLEIPSIPREVDPASLDQYLSLRYVPGPRTMFKNIFRLPPGHLLVADDAGVRVSQYWDIDYAATAPRRPERIVEEFRGLLDESVRLRLISEVPLGVFLSGGLDSSAILALTSKLCEGERVKTFSVGYEAANAQEESANEFDYARLAANAFSSDHHEYRLTPKEFESSASDLVWHLDEPLADASSIPLYFIAKQAREHIKVVLSGEGADEILAGYGIYPRMLALDQIYRRSPAKLVAPLVARFTPSEAIRNYVRMSGQPMESRYRGVSRGFNIEGKRRLVGNERLNQSERQLQELFGAYFDAVKKASPLNQMLYVDAKVWLPDDLLIKADKMTMANGLELRVPFLDHKFVEFAAALPDDRKLNGTGKAILRQAMRGVLPGPIIDRPKRGFPIPISSWLRGPLLQFTRDHLLTRHSACSSYFECGAVARVVEEHTRGRVDRSQEIWTLLVFELWHRRFIENHEERSCAA